MINEPRTRDFGRSPLTAGQCWSVGLKIVTPTEGILELTSQLVVSIPRSPDVVSGSPEIRTVDFLDELPGLIKTVAGLQAKILGAYLVRFNVV
jgi:hypothetical protein